MAYAPHATAKWENSTAAGSTKKSKNAARTLQAVVKVAILEDVLGPSPTHITTEEDLVRLVSHTNVRFAVEAALSVKKKRTYQMWFVTPSDT